MTYTNKMLSMTYMIDIAMETMRRYAHNRDFLETEEFLELQSILMEFQEKIFRRTDLPDNLNKRIERLAFKQLRNEVIHEHDSRLMRRKVYPDALGNIVVTDSAVLEIYACNNIDIDRQTGTPLIQGAPIECFGNGKHKGFIYCCDRCEHLQKCFPEKAEECLNILGHEHKHSWLFDEDGTAYCSNCHYEAKEDDYTGKPMLSKFCPNCGCRPIDK